MEIPRSKDVNKLTWAIPIKKGQKEGTSKENDSRKKRIPNAISKKEQLRISIRGFSDVCVCRFECVCVCVCDR